MVFYRRILPLIDKTRTQNEASHQCTAVQEVLLDQEPSDEPSVPEIFKESKKYRLYPVKR